MNESAFERILEALRQHGCKVVERGTQASAQCPAHEDRSPSLSVARNPDRVLLHCHAGCPTDVILSALDMSAADLFDEPRERGLGATGWKVAAEYEYRDEHGELLYVAEKRERFDNGRREKTMRYRRPDPEHPGRWLWSHGDRWVLYRLPEVLAAVEQDREVWIVEGEKDVNSLAALDLVATTNPGGAGKWEEEYSELLRGSVAFIITDNDEPGRKHAAMVAASLRRHDVDVTMYQPATGKDVSDHLGAGRDLAELVSLDEESDELPAEEPGSEAEEEPWTARVVSGGSFILDQPDTPPAVWGRDDTVCWAEGEALMLCGPAGVGKTTLANQLVAARLGLLDGDVLGLPVRPGAKKVLYLAMDRPPQISRALARLFSPADRQLLDERLVVWKGPPPYDMARRTELLAEMCAHFGADTVVVDSLKDAVLKLSEDESGSGYNRARQRALVEGVQVLELHHQRKASADNKKPSRIDDVYGSTWLTAGAGSVFVLWGQPGDPVVELIHLKQPMVEFGPHMIRHDHDAGRSALEGATDLLQIVRNQRQVGITAELAAKSLYMSDTPSRAEKEKARRRLETYERTGELVSKSGDHSTPTKWFLACEVDRWS